MFTRLLVEACCVIVIVVIVLHHVDAYARCCGQCEYYGKRGVG